MPRSLRMTARLLFWTVALVLAGCQKPNPEQNSPPATQSRATFVEPSDGASVPPTFRVVMRAEGMTIEPAGEINENAGHFHLLVDTPFVEAGQVIPADANHLHFGTGATETELTLTPGQHTIRVQVANGAHIAFDPTVYGSTISITVEQ